MNTSTGASQVKVAHLMLLVVPTQFLERMENVQFVPTIKKHPQMEDHVKVIWFARTGKENRPQLQVVLITVLMILVGIMLSRPSEEFVWTVQLMKKSLLTREAARRRL